MKFMENKWHWVAIAINLAGLLATRGGGAMLVPIGRIVVPLVVAYFVFKWFKNKFLGSALGNIKSQLEEAGAQVELK